MDTKITNTNFTYSIFSAKVERGKSSIMQVGGTSDKTCNKKIGLCAVTSLTLSPLYYAAVLGSVLGQSARCLPYPELQRTEEGL